MKVKKRTKTSRQRGTSSHGWGFKKKHRGKGHRGGIGKAGTGKRADHQKGQFTEPGKKYFGRSKTLRRGTPPKKLEVINLSEIVMKFKGKKEINLKGYKILSRGEVKEKLTIRASDASKSAIEKVKKAGGDILLE